MGGMTAKDSKFLSMFFKKSKQKMKGVLSSNDKEFYTILENKTLKVGNKSFKVSKDKLLWPLEFLKFRKAVLNNYKKALPVVKKRIKYSAKKFERMIDFAIEKSGKSGEDKEKLKLELVADFLASKNAERDALFGRVKLIQEFLGDLCNKKVSHDDLLIFNNFVNGYKLHDATWGDVGPYKILGKRSEDLNRFMQNPKGLPKSKVLEVIYYSFALNGFFDVINYHDSHEHVKNVAKSLQKEMKDKYDTTITWQELIDAYYGNEKNTEYKKISSNVRKVASKIKGTLDRTKK